MKTGLLFIIFFSAINFLYAQTRDVPYTLDDRDRLIRVEEQIKSLEVQVKSLREDMNNQVKLLREEMNTRFNYLANLIYVMLGGMFMLIGFVIWDRRTAVAPVSRDMKKIKEILYDLSKANPDLRELLNKAAL